ncbi:CUB and LDLa domain isoform X2 [Musca autumnalis]|uniref:CUB and LDLa domain isoform X2 n=1 Tax=Musca autumnalis TaxID=221902 RepID=UPI003CF55E0B
MLSNTDFKNLNIVTVLYRNVALIAVCLLSSVVAAYPSNTYKDLDICNHWNGRRHFLELGERGELHARNVTTSAYRSTLYSSASSTSSPSSVNGSPASSVNGGPNNAVKIRSNLDFWYQCNLELVTCAECVIRITVTFANFSKTCERIANTAVGKSSLCPCEHIQFSEPPYDNTISGQEFCGDGKVFRSKTRTLLLKFFYRATNSHVFSLQYFSERNVKIVSGTARPTDFSNNPNSNIPQIISTPYFPMNYPRDYGTEYILTCDSDNCHVRLDFTDFQLGLTSTMEIFDSNGQMVDSYTGEHFRPPIIISTGKSLLLQFRGNGVTSAGFRAEVTFVTPSQLKEDRLMPYTDCGGLVSGPGGAITMMNMIENATDVRMFDCIWIIKPSNNYVMMKTHISLRVDEFHSMASRSEVTIRQGTTSDAPEIEDVVWPNNGMSKENHVVPVLTGYYIRLRGVFGMSSKLAIVYSVFNYLNCYIGSEFLCNNNHCISIRLHCDGFDHCGDGSDEPDTCEEDWAHLQNDRRWYSHKPNYYFPKIEQYPDLKTATGIFVISTLGIFAVLSGWMVILYRMGVRARHQRELQNHLQTISELLDRQEEIIPDEPPSYEAPPDYEEVIKIGMDHEMREPRERQRQRKQHRRRRDRSCSRANSNTTVSSTVPIHNFSDMPSTSAAASEILNLRTTPETLQELEGANANVVPPVNVVPTPTTTDLVQQVARATQNCGITGTSQASETEAAQITCQCNCKGQMGGQLQCIPTTAVTENIVITPNSPPNTPQMDESARDFCDDSLNISCTLGVLQHPVSAPIPGAIINENNIEATARPKSSVNCTEQTYLKKTWIVMNNDGKGYRVQRLRPTFSSPESFLSDWSCYGDSQNYGSILAHDQRSIVSNNTSNCISDLSRDPSYDNGISFNMPPKGKNNGSYSLSNKIQDTTNNSASCSMYTTESGRTSDHNEAITTHLIMTSLELDSEDEERSISCFNNPFRMANANKSKYTTVAGSSYSEVGGSAGGNTTRNRRRHCRSKSFTNSGRSNDARQQNTIKRSSSANLLQSFESVSEITNSDSKESTLYLI